MFKEIMFTKEPGVVNLANYNKSKLRCDKPACKQVPALQVFTNEGRKEFCSISPHIPITTRPSHLHLIGNNGVTDKFIECQIYNRNGDRQQIHFDQIGRSCIFYHQNAKKRLGCDEVGSTYFSSAGLNHKVATNENRVVKGGKTVPQPDQCNFHSNRSGCFSALTDVS